MEWIFEAPTLSALRADDTRPDPLVRTLSQSGAMNLSRTQRGLMIHRRDCRYACNGTPWLWADDKANFDVWLFVRVFGYKTCKSCKPLEDR